MNSGCGKSSLRRVRSCLISSVPLYQTTLCYSILKMPIVRCDADLHWKSLGRGQRFGCTAGSPKPPSLPPQPREQPKEVTTWTADKNVRAPMSLDKPGKKQGKSNQTFLVSSTILILNSPVTCLYSRNDRMTLNCGSMKVIHGRVKEAEVHSLRGRDT